jgi:hypothetical protein
MPSSISTRTRTILPPHVLKCVFVSWAEVVMRRTFGPILLLRLRSDYTWKTEMWPFKPSNRIGLDRSHLFQPASTKAWALRRIRLNELQTIRVVLTERSGVRLVCLEQLQMRPKRSFSR